MCVCVCPTALGQACSSGWLETDEFSATFGGCFDIVLIDSAVEMSVEFPMSPHTFLLIDASMRTIRMSSLRVSPPGHCIVITLRFRDVLIPFYTNA